MQYIIDSNIETVKELIHISNRFKESRFEKQITKNHYALLITGSAMASTIAMYFENCNRQVIIDMFIGSEKPVVGNFKNGVSKTYYQLAELLDDNNITYEIIAEKPKKSKPAWDSWLG